MGATFGAALFELLQQVGKTIRYTLIDDIVINRAELLANLRLNFTSKARFFVSDRCAYIH
jgi:hypothetical protein